MGVAVSGAGGTLSEDDIVKLTKNYSTFLDALVGVDGVNVGNTENIKKFIVACRAYFIEENASNRLALAGELEQSFADVLQEVNSVIDQATQGDDIESQNNRNQRKELASQGLADLARGFFEGKANANNITAASIKGAVALEKNHLALEISEGHNIVESGGGGYCGDRSIINCMRDLVRLNSVSFDTTSQLHTIFKPQNLTNRSQEVNEKDAKAFRALYIGYLKEINVDDAYIQAVAKDNPVYWLGQQDLIYISKWLNININVVQKVIDRDDALFQFTVNAPIATINIFNEGLKDKDGLHYKALLPNAAALSLKRVPPSQPAVQQVIPNHTLVRRSGSGSGRGMITTAETVAQIFTEAVKNLASTVMIVDVAQNPTHISQKPLIEIVKNAIGNVGVFKITDEKNGKSDIHMQDPNGSEKHIATVINRDQSDPPNKLGTIAAVSPSEQATHDAMLFTLMLIEAMPDEEKKSYVHPITVHNVTTPEQIQGFTTALFSYCGNDLNKLHDIYINSSEAPGFQQALYEYLQGLQQTPSGNSNFNAFAKALLEFKPSQSPAMSRPQQTRTRPLRQQHTPSAQPLLGLFAGYKPSNPTVTQRLNTIKQKPD